MGVTVENESALSRIDFLKKIPAHVKFLSCEPLIGPLTNLDINGIDWVIVGGESGRKVREIKREWVVEIREKCTKHNIPFFFKQWGGTNKKKNGCDLDGKVYKEMPLMLCA